jgi:hypothetical protein
MEQVPLITAKMASNTETGVRTTELPGSTSVFLNTIADLQGTVLVT